MPVRPVRRTQLIVARNDGQGGAAGVVRARRHLHVGHDLDHELLALVRGEKVLDQEDVRLLVHELQPGVANVDMVKVALREVALERQVGMLGAHARRASRRPGCTKSCKSCCGTERASTELN